MAEAYAVGVEGRIVSKVSQQQRDFGTPLDDVEVEFRGSNGDTSTLSLQAKSAIVISGAAKNKDFRDVVRDSWATLKKPTFRKSINRFGVAVGDVATGKFRDLLRLCESARESTTTDHFDQRFAAGGNASDAVATIKADIISILTEQNGSAPTNAEVHDFLAHFVMIQFHFGHDGATTETERTTVLRGCLADGHQDRAPLLWSEFIEQKLTDMLARNPMRMEYQVKYEGIIADYNSEKDRTTIEETFRRLVELVRSLDEEQERAARENLSDEELAVFDLLKRDDLTKADWERVKQASRDMLASIKARLAQLDRFWEKEQTKGDVEAFILDEVFVKLPSPPFTPEEKKLVADNVYAHVWQQAMNGRFGQGDHPQRGR